MPLDLDDGRDRELDLELRPTEEADTPPPGPRRPGSLGALVILGLLAVGLAIGFYWRPLPLPQTTPESVAAAAEASPSLDVPTEFGPVPPLDQSDEFVRALVRQLSSRPELVAWMAGPNLARTLVAAVDKIAIGSRPARELRAAAPAGTVQTLGAGRTLRIDPRSFER
jgi:hypothetical protein